MELAQKCLFWGGIKVYMPGALGFDRSQGGTWGEFLLLLLSWETSLGRGFFCIDSYFRETDKLNSPPLWLKAKSMLLHMKEQMLRCLLNWPWASLSSKRNSNLKVDLFTKWRRKITLFQVFFGLLGLDTLQGCWINIVDITLTFSAFHLPECWRDLLAFKHWSLEQLANCHSAWSEYISSRQYTPHCILVSEFRNEQRIESFCSHRRQLLFVHSVFLTVPLQYLSLIQKPGGRSYYASAVSSSTSTASLRLLVPSNPSTRSMGRGNTTVWFFSVLMQLRVWKGGEIGFFWINIDNLSRGPNSCSTYENLEKYNYGSSVSLAPDSICILGFFCQNRWTHLQWKGKRNLEKLKTN